MFTLETVLTVLLLGFLLVGLLLHRNTQVRIDKYIRDEEDWRHYVQHAHRSVSAFTYLVLPYLKSRGNKQYALTAATDCTLEEHGFSFNVRDPEGVVVFSQFLNYDYIPISIMNTVYLPNLQNILLAGYNGHLTLLATAQDTTYL